MKLGKFIAIYVTGLLVILGLGLSLEDQFSVFGAALTIAIYTVCFAGFPLVDRAKR